MKRHIVAVFVCVAIGTIVPFVSFAATTIKSAPTNGLVGYWSFNEGTSTRADDSSRYKNHGTLSYGPTWINGRLKKGVSFDKIDDLVSVPSSASLDDLSTMTLSAWVYPRSDGEGNLGRIFQKGGGTASPTNGWFFAMQGFTGLRFTVDYLSDLNVYTNEYPAVNKWTHVALTWTGTINASDVHIYINGNEATYFSQTNAVLSRASDAGQTLGIGNNSATTRTFDGVIDEARIYNRVLSASEIRQLYQVGLTQLNTTASPSPKTASSLVGWWTFDGKDVSPSVAYDRSGQGNNATINNAPQPVLGKLGQAFNFFPFKTDRNSRVVVADPVSGVFDFGSSDFSISFSMRNRGFFDQTSTANVVLSKKNNESWHAAGYVFLYDNTNVLNFHVGNGVTSGSVVTAGSIADNTWHHYVGIRGSGVLSLYVDGVLVSTTTISGSVNNSEDLVIGADNVGANGYPRNVNADIDDVRIYNFALPTTEVRNLYNQTKGSTVGKCGAGPVLDADGNKYSIVQIGTQCWLDRNMNVGIRISGGTNQTNNGTIEKYCYQNSDSNCTDPHPKRPDGGLYQWDEAMQYSTTEGVRGICPSGWHIPTDYEWYTLENYLKANGQSCDASRSSGTSDCFPAGERLLNGGNSGFDGNRSGLRTIGNFWNRGSDSRYWSSTENGTSAWSRNVPGVTAKVSRHSTLKTDAVSVRCIKN